MVITPMRIGNTQYMGFLSKLFGKSDEANSPKKREPIVARDPKPYIRDAKRFLKLYDHHEAGGISFDKFKQQVEMLEHPPIIAERTCCLMDDSCDFCVQLAGLSALVGTPVYEATCPPGRCENGEDECTCIWTYIMWDEQGFAERVRTLLEDGYQYVSTHMKRELVEKRDLTMEPEINVKLV